MPTGSAYELSAPHLAAGGQSLGGRSVHVPLSLTQPRRAIDRSGRAPQGYSGTAGHASIKTTLDTYGHLFEGMDEAAADRLDEAWRVSPVDARWMQGVPNVIALTAE